MPHGNERSKNRVAPLGNEPQGFAHELRRKLFHILLGIILILLFWSGIISSITFFVLFLIGVAISLVYVYEPVAFITYFLRRFDRIESVPGRGALTFMAGFTLAASLFSKNIALACMAVLTIADAAAALIGRFGNIPYSWAKHKTFEGGLAFVFFAFIASVPFLPITSGYLAAITGAVVEGAPRPNGSFLKLLLDDNIIIPLAVGIVLALVM